MNTSLIAIHTSLIAMTLLILPFGVPGCHFVNHFISTISEHLLEKQFFVYFSKEGENKMDLKISARTKNKL